jgi:hypothetical protein
LLRLYACTCGPPPGSWPGDDVRQAVTVYVRGGYADGALEGGEVGEEAGELGDAARSPDREDADGPARSGGPGDDFSDAVAVHITARDEHPARKRRSVGVEAGDLGDATAGETEGAHVWSARRTGPRDDVGQAVAGHVGRRHSNAAAEDLVVRVEVGDLPDATSGEAESAHLREAARAGTRDDVGQTITVNITARHVHAAAKERVEGVEAGQRRDAAARETPHEYVRARRQGQPRLPGRSDRRRRRRTAPWRGSSS